MEGNKTLMVSLNTSCNQDCLFCQNKDNYSEDSDIEEVKKNIINALKRGNIILFSGGGEPTMYDNLIELIRFAKESGAVRVGLETNGVKLSNLDYVKKLKNAGLDYINVSLHSHKAEVSDLITNTPGTFEKTIMGIKNIGLVGIELSVIMHTITKYNYKDLVDFVKFVHNNFKFKELAFGFVRPKLSKKSGRDIAVRYMDAELYIHKALEYCEENNIKCSFSIGFSPPLCYLQGHEHYSQDVRNYVLFDRRVFEEDAKLYEKTKFKVCDYCLLKNMCPGVPKQYVELFGDSEFYPVFLEEKFIVNKVKPLTSDVVVLKADYNNIKQRIEQAINMLGGIRKFVKPGDKVLIKPNVVSPLPPEKAATTHPSVVKAIIEIVKEVTPNIWVGDCSAGDTAGITEQAFKVSRIMNVIDEEKVEFRNLQEEPFMPVELKHFTVVERTDFAKAALEADVIINVPKLKTHGITFLTGALKNLFGLVHPEERKYFHKEYEGGYYFNNVFVDIYNFFNDKIKLNIMDAVVGMQGDQGPAHGEPKNIGLVLVSTDGVALDAVASEIVGYKPLGIQTTRIAFEKLIGIGDLKQINILGEKLEDVKIKDFKKTSLFDYINKYKRDKNYPFLAPVVNKKDCVGCGYCFENCPVGAIDMVETGEGVKKADICPDKCIKCFICKEVCPTGAVVVKKFYNN